MNLNFEIAKRYIFGKKSTSAINIITWISIIGITIGTAALILILSVFNGLEGLITQMYSSFNPDLKVIPIEGKYFETNDELIAKIKDIDGVLAVSRTLEEYSLFEYKEVQKAGKIKGVDNLFQSVTQLDSMLTRGDFKTANDRLNYAVIGKGLAANLSLNFKDAITPISAYMPIRKSTSVINQLGKEFKTINMYPGGVFSVGSEADVQYLITNIDAAAELLSLDKGMVSSLEIKMDLDKSEKHIKAAVLELLGNDNFSIENRYEQDKETLRTINVERWISYLIVILTLILIAFNMVSCLWMMVLEKKKDISILRSMGYDTKSVRNIFLLQGMIITGIGILLGIIVAFVLYFLQKQFGLIGIPNGFVMTAYPVELKLFDFLITIVTVIIIGWLASILPAYRAGLVSAFVREEMI